MEMNCKHCGNSFVSSNNKVFCSEDCYKEFNRIKARTSYRLKKHQTAETIYKKRICPVCENEFKFNFTSQPNKKYCSKECRETTNSIKFKKTDNRYIIFERDTFKCIYCGKTTEDYDIVLTCDHIIPQDEGGEHFASNLITACHVCNGSKGKKKLKTESMNYVQNIVDKRNKEQNIHPNLKISSYGGF